MHSKVCDEITYINSKFDTKIFCTLYNGHDYLSILGYKLHHVSKRAPGGK